MQAARPSALVALSFVSAMSSACSRSDPRAAPSVSTAAPITRPAPLAIAAAPATIAAPAGAERHACSKDADCLLSCFHGAVNAAWYHAAVPDGDLCEDGCASKGLTVSCDGQRCVAKQKGELVPGCTGLLKPITATTRRQ